jgi:hypothetical protein
VKGPEISTGSFGGNVKEVELMIGDLVSFVELFCCFVFELLG